MTQLRYLLAVAILGVMLLAGCGPQVPTPVVAGPTAEATVAPLVGAVTRDVVEWHSGWEELRAADYPPDPAALDVIRQGADGVQVLLFLGTWCGDSRREVPRFFKIMDQAGWDASALSIVALDRSKTDADGLTDQWSIEYVPTFVLLRDGREIGRIVESPRSTLEGDLAEMLGQG